MIGLFMAVLRENDLQHVTVEQNGETEDTWKTGRTGGLPFIGKGAYKRIIEIPDTTDCSYTLVFDWRHEQCQCKY